MKGRDRVAGFFVAPAKPVAFFCVWACLGATVLTAGCSKKAAIAKYDLWGESTRAAPTPEVGALRYVATRHNLEVVAPETKLPQAWKAVVDFCGTISCEVLTSSITTHTSESAASGSVSLRLAPEALNPLLGFVEKQGNIVQHTTESEDKTAQVIDAEARIKNLTSFRDNLRSMQAKSSIGVKDLVEIQRQLTEVQSQL